ncbi:MAG TPA: Sec-independent protein translocase subunit TatA [Hyphomicrobiales bacterium]|nr:Sec-independent protein translocase subunit TatA [Hyphomicrobiales bacterium]
MGAGAFGIWKLLILLGIVFMVFGTKKLKNLGSDLGTAIKGFKSAIDEGKPGADTADESPQADVAHTEQAEDPR